MKIEVVRFGRGVATHPNMNQDSEASLDVEELKSKLDFLTEAARRRRRGTEELQETFLENQITPVRPGAPQWSALHD
jgi:hypothetical protein